MRDMTRKSQSLRRTVTKEQKTTTESNTSEQMCEPTDLCYKHIVLHLLSGLHDANNGGFNLMLSVIVHFLPGLLPFRVRLSLFSNH